MTTSLTRLDDVNQDQDIQGQTNIEYYCRFSLWHDRSHLIPMSGEQPSNMTHVFGI